MQSLIYNRLGNKLLKKFISRGYARWFRPSALDQSVLVGAAGRKAYRVSLECSGLGGIRWKCVQDAERDQGKGVQHKFCVLPSRRKMILGQMERVQTSYKFAADPVLRTLLVQRRGMGDACENCFR